MYSLDRIFINIYYSLLQREHDKNILLESKYTYQFFFQILMDDKNFRKNFGAYSTKRHKNNKTFLCFFEKNSYWKNNLI